MTRFADRFVLEKEIGSGGMSRVFLGRDEILDRQVAIKLLRGGFGEESDVGIRFRREGRTAARLSHPNIVRVYDAGEGEFEGRETSYIVMEYLPGGDLRSLIDEMGRLPEDELARIGAEVCAGLAHAHDRGVIHRDIKPHNILLDAAGHAKLTDFGIARALDATQATRTGHFLGTALYSSPEQLEGRKVGPKSDVYSLGATLYQAATGEPPFTGSPITVASQHVSKPPPPPREKNPALSPEMEGVILSCLSKNPAERPAARELGERLGAIAGGTREHQAPAAPPPPDARRAPRTEREALTRPEQGPARRRGRGLVAALAVLGVLALIGAFALPSLLGGDGNNTSQRNEGARNPSGGQGGGGQQPQQQQPQQQQPQPQEPQQPPPTQTTPEQTQPAQDGGGLTGEAAAQTVEDVYSTAASGDYGASYALLSSGFKQRNAPTQAQWSGQFETLQSIRWEEGPNARVSGDTATVTGTTIAVHTDRTERNTGIWTLVREDGEWKLESLSIQNREIIG